MRSRPALAKRAAPAAETAEQSPEAVRSVERAVSVIRAIADTGQAGSRLTDLARATGLSKTTVHRLLATLVNVGWVEFDGFSSTYLLGLPLVGLGMLASERHGVTSLAAPHLNRIAELTGDTAYLTVKLGTQAVCVDRAIGTYPIKTVTTQIGQRRLLGTCAGSLALLAWARDDEAARLLASISDGRGAADLPDPADLTILIDRARAVGFTQAPTVLVPGADAIGVPVFDACGTAVAAFSVEAVAARLAEPRRSHIVNSMKHEAAIFARRLRRLEDDTGEASVHRLLPRAPTSRPR